MLYQVKIGELIRDLPICPIGTDVSIAFLDVLGDVELLDAFAESLRPRLQNIDVLFCGDTVGLVVGHHLSLRLSIPYVAARKRRTPDMVDEPITADSHSIAANSASTFFLAAHKAKLLADRRVCVVDEVTSTGSTVQALRSIAEQSQCASVMTAVVATEGRTDHDAIALAHLPVFGS